LSLWLILWLPLLGCDSTPVGAADDPTCQLGQLATPITVVNCLALSHAISTADQDSALLVLATATHLEDSLATDTTSGALGQAGSLTISLAGVGEFYARQLFPDSVRFHRIMDQVVITVDNTLGLVPHDALGAGLPPTTPYLVWHVYPNLGLYFQPVETAEQAVYVLPRTDIPLDSLVAIAQHLYAYALWREVGGLRYPVWEYEFDYTSGGVTNTRPWISGLAEGMAMMIFTEAYRRTGDGTWLSRAYETLNALRVPWDRGGVLLPDTTHGYWWEGFNPVAQIWNEAAEALADVAFLANVSGDPAVQQMYAKGAAAMKYYTPFYDTGTWTLYSRTQGYNGTFYHNLSIQRLQGLYTLTGDPWYQTLANRWSSYTPPPGIQ